MLHESIGFCAAILRSVTIAVKNRPVYHFVYAGTGSDTSCYTSCSITYIIADITKVLCVLLTEGEVQIEGYWSSFFFPLVWTKPKAKKNARVITLLSRPKLGQ